jgi:GTPase SAR1 family protein
MNDKEIKLLVIGDFIGCPLLMNTLLFTYVEQNTKFKYLPSTFSEGTVTKNLGEQRFKCELSTIGGTETHESVRHLYYPRTDVILLVFHYHAKESFINATTVWLTEIRKNLPAVPVVLVGLKDNYHTGLTSQDLVVDQDEAKATTKTHGVAVFVECSLNNLNAVNHVFNLAFFCALALKAEDKASRKIAKQFYLECQRPLEIENKFIAQAIEIAKARRKLNQGHFFNIADRNIIKKILFFTAAAQGCERDPSNATSLILENVRDRKANNWKQGVTVENKEKRIFCAESYPGNFSDTLSNAFFAPSSAATGDQPHRPARKAGCTIS